MAIYGMLCTSCFAAPGLCVSYWSSGRGAVQSKVVKHLVRLGSLSEKGNSRIGGVTIARLLALLESSKAFHNVLLRHSIFSFLQVLAGRYNMLILLASPSSSSFLRNHCHKIGMGAS